VNSIAAKRPLKILMLLNRVPYPLNDGGAIGTYNFIKGYAEEGCELFMLFMNTGKHFVEEEKIGDLFSLYGKYATVFIDNKIKVLDALSNLFSADSYVISRFVSQTYRDHLKIVLEKKEFDIVHLDGLPVVPYLELIRKYSKSKIVIRAHNVEHVIWERVAENEKNLLKAWYLKTQALRLRKFEQTALNSVDLVLAISKEDEAIIRSLNINASVTIVPAGIDVPEDIPAKSEAHDLFFIGAFDWQPNLQGIEWFIDTIWNAIKEGFPALKFVIAGKKMPHSINKHNDGGIIAIGEVADAKEFILKHGIMIVPVISGSGVRIKIIEAMALGKTIIATSIAVEGLGVTNNENILIADTSEDFVSQIDKCLNDGGYKERIGENAHKFALENFQNRKIFEKLIGKYEQIISCR